MNAQWANAAEFFHMGGYWFFVWGSYSVALLLMLAEPLLARRRHRQALLDAAHGSEDDLEDFDRKEAR
jgi:heme exporter protein D